MSVVPTSPKIYHITHLQNLGRIRDAGLWSDAERIRQRLDCTVVGMKEIKRRRLEELYVDCHRTTRVGEYVPFYFCPRSIMLYLLHMGNHPDVSYRGGQGPIVHLEADLRKVVGWANENRVRWAFSDSNAGARYAAFSNELDKLAGLDWNAIDATDWRASMVRERKQAEFLVERFFPWSLVDRVGVIDQARAQAVADEIVLVQHKPEIVVQRNWYY